MCVCVLCFVKVKKKEKQEKWKITGQRKSKRQYECCCMIRIIAFILLTFTRSSWNTSSSGGACKLANFIFTMWCCWRRIKSFMNVWKITACLPFSWGKLVCDGWGFNFTALTLECHCMNGRLIDRQTHRERKKERKREKERESACVCVASVCVCVCVG